MPTFETIKFKDLNGILCIEQNCQNLEQSHFLTTSEIDHSNNLKISKLKQNFIVSRYCAKMALKQIFPESLLTDWYIKTGSLGQPILTHVHGFDKQYTISLSHSFQAAAAFAFPHAYPSGIDVENILRKTPTSLIVSQCLEAEKKLFDIENRLEAFCFWTAKEAISKVFMIGLTVNTSLYEIISFQQLTSNTWRIRFKNFKPYQVICVYQHPIIYAVAIHESAKFLKDYKN